MGSMIYYVQTMQKGITMKNKTKTIENILSEALVGRVIEKIDEFNHYAGKIEKCEINDGGFGAGVELTIEGKGEIILPFDQRSTITFKE
jgi:hypothetical protein